MKLSVVHESHTDQLGKVYHIRVGDKKENGATISKH